jgi:hypothetical protein
MLQWISELKDFTRNSWAEEFYLEQAGKKNVILKNCAEKTWSNWAEIGLLGTVRAAVLKGVP